jgi:hypothetical protein
MGFVPGFEGGWIFRAEEEAADTGYGHVSSPPILIVGT